MKSRRPDKKKSDTHIETGISVAGHATFKKTISVQGAAELRGTVSVAGDISLKGRAIVNIGLSVDGPTVLKKLHVKELAVFDKPVSIKNTLLAKSLIVGSDAMVHGDLKAEKNIDCHGKLHVKDRSFLNQLLVGELLTVQGDSIIRGHQKIDKDLSVDGNASIAGDIKIDGNALLKSLNINESVKIGEDLTVKANLYIGGTSTFHAKATCKDSLRVKKDVSIYGGATVKESLTVDKNIKAINLKIDEDANIGGELSANTLRAMAGKFDQVLLTNDFLVEKDAEIKGNIIAGDNVSCRTLKAESVHIKEDATISGDLIVKKGLCVAEKSVLKEVHCDELAMINGSIISGVYHPEIRQLANNSYYASYECQYMKIGEVVTVSGRIDLEPEKPDEPVEISVTLPFGADFKEAGNLSGSGLCSNGVMPIVCYGDALNNNCKMIYRPAGMTRSAFFFSFTYRVIK